MKIKNAIISLFTAFCTVISFSSAVWAEETYVTTDGTSYIVEEQLPVLPKEYSLEKQFQSIDALIEAEKNPNLFLASSEAELTLDYMKWSWEWHFNDPNAKFAATDAAADAIIAKMDPSWSELTKVMYINDYLTYNCEYDRTLSKYCAYNCIVEKTSVCQGYAEAFFFLMYKLGIDCRIISSEALNHAWNMVKVDGEWYQIDVTWNDPVPDTKGNSGHTYMLISEALMRERGHNAADWVFRYETGASAAGYCTSTKYDDYFWQGCNKPVIINGDNYYYMIKESDIGSGVAKADKDNNITIIKDMSGFKWNVFQSTAWWVGNFGSVCRYKDLLIYNSSTTIYTCDFNGENEKVLYTLTEDELSKGYIYGLSIKNNVVTYSISTKPGGDIVATGTVEVSDASPETLEKVSNFVDRLYTIILDRNAEEAGLTDWTNKLVTSKATSAEIVYGIANSQEFANRGLSNDQIVETMYQAMLGRASDEGGKANWLNCLNSGMTVTGIINGFSGSTEFANICAEYGIQAGAITSCEARDRNNGLTSFVSRMYTKALNRTYDVNGLNDWTNRYLTNVAGVSDIAFGFIFSPEFVGKNLSDSDYVDTLYRTFFNREPDEGGKADWLNKLANGMAREDVLNGFVGSQECINLVNSFGI